jgi:asparagine synthase (glutamine-hydrolysing)
MCPVTTWDEQPLAGKLRDPSLADLEKYFTYRTESAPPFFFDPSSHDRYHNDLLSWDQSSTESSNPDSRANRSNRGSLKTQSTEVKTSSLALDPIHEADHLRQGKLRFFSNAMVDVGFPIRWHRDPFSGSVLDSKSHWSKISDFGAGDIKLIWEPNRFAFVYTLVRAYWRTGDESYAELFWQLVENWRLENRPESGCNWKCGQEISLRVMAWCFGLYGFGCSAASTPARVANLAQMIAVSGHRIEANISYALSQRNNHGLSEAAGLWTIGSLFPEFTRAERWANTGRQLLESQARKLLYSDGAFSQHSMNYHRVMLHCYLWSIRLGEQHERPFSDRLIKQIERAGNFLYQVQDEASGQVPCYGHDDGALILPLNNCHYRDFRPIVQSIHYLTRTSRRFDGGPWDEDLFWLFGAVNRPNTNKPHFRLQSQSTLKTQTKQTGARTDFVASAGGYYTLRSSNGFAFVRAAKFRHRPAQADMLHVDIWWRGLNIAVDPGTYSYNAPAPWDNPFSNSSCHNTVTIDDTDQMEKAGRFLWLPWAIGKSFNRETICRGDVSCWNGEHNGYRRSRDPVIHRRGLVRLGSDHWLVVDALSGRTPHDYRLHWLMADSPYDCNTDPSITLHTDAGAYRAVISSTDPLLKFEVVRAAADSTRGWRSTHYHSREPALSVSLCAHVPKIVFATMLGPEAVSPVIDRDQIFIRGTDWRATVSLNSLEMCGVSLIASVVAEGSLATIDRWTPDESRVESQSLMEWVN